MGHPPAPNPIEGSIVQCAAGASIFSGVPEWLPVPLSKEPF
jgi:hypothetical protein